MQHYVIITLDQVRCDNRDNGTTEVTYVRPDKFTAKAIMEREYLELTVQDLDGNMMVDVLMDCSNNDYRVFFRLTRESAKALLQDMDGNDDETPRKMAYYCVQVPIYPGSYNATAEEMVHEIERGIDKEGFGVMAVSLIGSIQEDDIGKYDPCKLWWENLSCEERGYLVCSYLKREVDDSFDPGWYENDTLPQADIDLREAIVKVHDFVADCTDNEWMRIEKE